MKYSLCIRFLRYLLVRGRFCLTFRNLPELVRRPTKYRGDWKQQSCVFQICQFLLSTLASNELQSETCSKRLDTCQIVSMILSTTCILKMRIGLFRIIMSTRVQIRLQYAPKCPSVGRVLLSDLVRQIANLDVSRLDLVHGD